MPACSRKMRPTSSMVSGWDWVECPERTAKLGGGSEDVCALAGDHAVGLSGNQPVAEHGPRSTAAEMNRKV